jgi:Cu(I)/Ag(I) efflux system periplasmic protein CusF
MNPKRLFTRTTSLAFVLSSMIASPAWAASHQGGHGTHGDHGKPMAPEAIADMTDGEVRKVDKDGGKVTLKHGEIKSLDMPPMTMVFVVKDKVMIDKLKAGDMVKFKAVNEAGKYVVTDIRPAK